MEKQNKESTSISDFIQEHQSEPLRDNSQQSHSAKINEPETIYDSRDQILKDSSNQAGNTYQSSDNEQKTVGILNASSKQRLFSEFQQINGDTQNQNQGETLITSRRFQRRKLNEDVDLETFDLDHIRNNQTHNQIVIDQCLVSQQPSISDISHQQQAQTDPLIINSNLLNQNILHRQNSPNTDNIQESEERKISNNPGSAESIQQEELNLNLDDRKEASKESKMNSQIQKDQEGLNLMIQVELEVICSICYKRIDPQDQASLESCIHVFCFECILKWAINSRNICPYCKSVLNKITYTDDNGLLKDLQIDDKCLTQEESDDQVIYYDYDTEDDDERYQQYEEDEQYESIDEYDNQMDQDSYDVCHICRRDSQYIGQSDCEWICSNCTVEASDSDDFTCEDTEVSDNQQEYLSKKQQSLSGNQCCKGQEESNSLRERQHLHLNLVPSHDFHTGGGMSNTTTCQNTNSNQQRQLQVVEMIDPRSIKTQQQQSSNSDSYLNKENVNRKILTATADSSSSSGDSSDSYSSSGGSSDSSQSSGGSSDSSQSSFSEDSGKAAANDRVYFQSETEAIISQPFYEQLQEFTKHQTSYVSESLGIPQRQVLNQESQLSTPEELLNAIQTGSNSVNDVSIQLTVDRREQSALEQVTSEANDRIALSHSQQSYNNSNLFNQQE
eukprot:403337356